MAERPGTPDEFRGHSAHGRPHADERGLRPDIEHDPVRHPAFPDPLDRRTWAGVGVAVFIAIILIVGAVLLWLLRPLAGLWQG